MKRVLLLAYYFPPIGGAGAQRPVKFVRHLPSLGYEPIVVTGPGDSIGRWTPADATLSADIPSGTRVVRVPGPEPQGAGTWSARWGNRAERWLGLPSAWSRWWISGAVEAGAQFDDVDVVYSWMSPYDSAEAALRLSQAIGKPWVADLGDPWALDEMMVFPSGLHRQQELRRMRRLLASAAAIVMSTPEAVLRVRAAFPELASKQILAIPNGFDANDFEEPVPVRSDGKFRIVHTGYLHTELGRQQRRTAALHRLLGGETRGVDIMTRSHVYLLQAIDRLIAEDASLADRVEVHLAGVLSDSDREIAGLSSVVRLARVSLACGVDLLDAFGRLALFADAESAAGPPFGDGAGEDVRVPGLGSSDPGRDPRRGCARDPQRGRQRSHLCAQRRGWDGRVDSQAARRRTCAGATSDGSASGPVRVPTELDPPRPTCSIAQSTKSCVLPFRRNLALRNASLGEKGHAPGLLLPADWRSGGAAQLEVRSLSPRLRVRRGSRHGPRRARGSLDTVRRHAKRGVTSRNACETDTRPGAGRFNGLEQPCGAVARRSVGLVALVGAWSRFGPRAKVRISR